MSIADEIKKLQELKESGALTEQEFEQAKKKLLSDPPGQVTGISNLPGTGNNNAIGKAANRYVSLQIVMAIVGIIIFLIMLFGIILPHFSHAPSMPRFR